MDFLHPISHSTIILSKLTEFQIEGFYFREQISIGGHDFKKAVNITTARYLDLSQSFRYFSLFYWWLQTGHWSWIKIKTLHVSVFKQLKFGVHDYNSTIMACDQWQWLYFLRYLRVGCPLGWSYGKTWWSAPLGCPSTGQNMVKCPLGCLSSGKKHGKISLGGPSSGQNMVKCLPGMTFCALVPNRIKRCPSLLFLPLTLKHPESASD